MTFKKIDQIPDFLVIGAGKSGTTSLDNYLKQHPSIFIPTIKEPNFFGYETSTKDDFKDEPEELNHFNQSITTLEEYLELFANAKPGQIKGETSNTYMYHETAPGRIKHYNPGMKLVAILRQPVSRLYSRYLHLAREGRQPALATCFDKNSIWWKRNDLIKEGFYYRNLSKFYNEFPEKNIKVILYENFNRDPNGVLFEIFEFLGVDPAFQPNTDARFNQSGFVKNKGLDMLYGQKSPFLGLIKKVLPEMAIGRIRESPFFQKTINSLRGKNLVRPQLDSAIQQRLLKEVYLQDIEELQDLIKQDLRHWLKR